VVKFNRFCQSVGVTAIDPNLNYGQDRVNRIKSSHFLSPFEEFGSVAKLREAAGLRIPIKTPLAIYSPPTRYLDWQLGRESHLKSIHSRSLMNNQAGLPDEKRIDYDWERQYILLYRWMNGVDAETAVHKGLISESQMVALGRIARETMEAHGWEVMDHKPRHVILRMRRNDQLARRKGELLWGLVDYELLYPYSSAGNP
jgi:hypothetical protein